jgi:hypothetical protein
MKERRKDYMQGSREEELYEGGGRTISRKVGRNDYMKKEINT